MTPITGWTRPTRLPEETGDYLVLMKTSTGSKLSYIQIRRFYWKDQRWGGPRPSPGWVIAGWLDLNALAEMPYEDGQPVAVPGVEEVDQ